MHMLSGMREASTAEQAPPAEDELRTSDELAVTTKRAAHLLGISRRNLYNLIYAGEITTVKIPSSTGRPNEHRIEISEIRAFLDRNRQQVPH